MLIEIEKTPNPATRKFMPGRKVMESGGRDFPNADSAEASPLAEALFATGQIDGVYFGRDFVSVSAAPTVEWEALEPDVLSIMLDHFLLDAPLFKPGTAAGIEVAPEGHPSFDDNPADADVIEQIKELIETRVRPAVAQDGLHRVRRPCLRLRLLAAHGGVGRRHCRRGLRPSVRRRVATGVHPRAGRLRSALSSTR